MKRTHSVFDDEETEPNRFTTLPVEVLHFLVLKYMDSVDLQCLRFVSSSFHFVVHSLGKDHNLPFVWDCPLNVLKEVLQREKGEGVEKPVKTSVLPLFRFFRSVGVSWCEATSSAAAKNGHFDVLRYCHASGCALSSKNLTSDAAEGGFLEIVKWIFEISDGSGNCTWAAKTGQLEILKWAQENDCFWDEEEAAVLATENGHFDILKWIHSVGDTVSRRIPKMVSTAAAVTGNWEILKWAREKGGNWDSDSMSHIAATGNWEILKWARENGCDWDRMTCENIAASGNLEMLQWARENGCDWDKDTCSFAAAAGHLEILKWAREHNCSWNQETILKAAFAGNFEISQWAISNGCPNYADIQITPENFLHHKDLMKFTNFVAPDSDEYPIWRFVMMNSTCDRIYNFRLLRYIWGIHLAALAAKLGKLDVLKFLHEKQCPMDYHVCKSAAANGNFEILKWAVEVARLEVIHEKVGNSAAKNGHLKVLKWLVARGCPVSKKTVLSAIYNRHLPIVEFLIYDCKIPKKLETENEEETSSFQFRQAQLVTNKNEKNWLEGNNKMDLFLRILDAGIL